MSDELSFEEQLRRERMRLFARGVVSYEWIERKSDKAQLMMIPQNGQIFVAKFNHKDDNIQLHTVYDGSNGAAIDPHWAPDGSQIAFIIERDLYVINVSIPNENNTSIHDNDNNNKLRRLTYAGSEVGVSCGVADFIAQEEMDRYNHLTHSLTISSTLSFGIEIFY